MPRKDIKARQCGNSYVLQEEYVILNEWLKIPKGYKWKGKAIPRILRCMLGSPFRPQFMRATLVHEYLYHRTDVSAKCNDQLFKGILLEDDTHPIVAQILYLAKRLHRVIKFT